jgi:hypothetical protein
MKSGEKCGVFIMLDRPSSRHKLLRTLLNQPSSVSAVKRGFLQRGFVIFMGPKVQ